MAKSLVYATNTTTQAVAPSNYVNFGNVTRKIGCGISVSGSTITFGSAGYYDIDFDATFVGTEGNVIIKVVQNGIPVVGASAVETIDTATTEYHTIGIDSTIRVYCCLGTTISVMIDSASTSTPSFTNTSIRVEKI